MTAAFGRSFSKLEVGLSWLHPTEIVLAAVLVGGLARMTPAAWVRRVRATGALVPLLVLWLFGAIAAVRGLSVWGFSSVLNDIGLVEYSLLVPLLALVVRDRFQLKWISHAIVLGGVLAIAVQAATLWAPSAWNFDGRLQLIEGATGLYVGVYAVWVAARVAAGASVAGWHYPVLVLGIALTIVGAARSAWVGLLVGFAVVLVFAPSGGRLSLAALITAALLLGTLVSVPLENPGGARAPRVATELQATFDESGGKEGSFQNATVRWRLAFWRVVLEDSARNPVLGVGFGKPTNFEFAGTTYDTRMGDTNNSLSVTPPHNSFINLLYRTGMPGLLAVAALMFIAVRRLLPVILSARGDDRALSIWLLAALATITTTAIFFTTLEGPYMAIFFWATLGLALLAPCMLASSGAPNTEPEPTISSPDPERMPTLARA